LNLEIGVYKILQALPIQALLLQLPIHSSFKPKGGHPTSHPGLPQFKPPRKKGKCLYCKGPRPAYNCNVITNWEMGDGLSLKKRKKCALTVWKVANLLPVNHNINVINVGASTTLSLHRDNTYHTQLHV